MPVQLKVGDVECGSNASDVDDDGHQAAYDPESGGAGLMTAGISHRRDINVVRFHVSPAVSLCISFRTPREPIIRKRALHRSSFAGERATRHQAVITHRARG